MILQLEEMFPVSEMITVGYPLQGQIFVHFEWFKCKFSAWKHAVHTGL